MDQPIKIERLDTDYGFVLIDRNTPAGLPDGSYYIEAFGQAGFGRFEMFFSCSCSPEDTLDDMLAEAARDEDVPVYRDTVRRLAPTDRTAS